MRWMVAAIVFMSLYGSGALACSCGDIGDDRAAVAEAMEKADLVFIGRIESQEKFTLDEDDMKHDYERTQFYVVQSWKGEKATRVYVESMVTCCMCGIRFPETGSFLVYAYGPKPNGYYTTSVCSRTKPLADANDEIAMLDAIVAEAEPASSSTATKQQ
jgi:hypothetical protein